MGIPMGDLSETVANFPPEQRAIREKCFHRTGTFIEFRREDLDQSIADRFEQQAARYPYRVAFRSRRHTLTYGELNRRANRLAHAILARPDIAQLPIALLFEHDAPFVVASIGVLKTDKVQVPLESGFPQARLCAEDADILVQIRGGDVMWQKERLLNLVLDRATPDCDKIAWLDCDIVFGREDWAEQASGALDRHVLVHLFHERHNLPRHARAGDSRSSSAPAASCSVVARLAGGEAGPEDLFAADAPLEWGSTAGLAWASRRDVLESHGLYDACILGTGDRAILCAALGQLDYGVCSTLMNARCRRHYLDWARPYWESVKGRVGSIPGQLFHLWHGDIEHRQYASRHRGLRAFDFDPYNDIAVDAAGAWRWNSDKEALHAFVRSYFESRNEDGVQDRSVEANLS